MNMCMYVSLNTPILCSSFIVRDKASHLYKTTGKITVLFISGQQTGRQKTLRWMIASIPCLQSALYFFMNGILICSGCSQIYLFHTFKGFITYLCIVILSGMLVQRRNHIPNFSQLLLLDQFPSWFFSLNLIERTNKM
jgi:hypothetical protein